ncbi:MAG: hypothetical protein ACR2N2_06545 [Acidimicrobiia bacterium]
MSSKLIRWSKAGGGVPAGIVDAGFASLATFVAGLAAVNLLSDENRGVYGVFFAAFVVGTTFPHNLVFLPYQVYSVAQPMAERFRYIGKATAIGFGFGMLGAGAILIAALATASYTTAAVTIALTVTAVPTVAFSAAQDNLRRMQHVCEHHWAAAITSIVQFVCVVAVIGLMLAADVPVVWMPFGSLLIANIISLSFGIIREGGLGRWTTPVELYARSLVRSGRWLLGQAIVLPGATFVAAALITAFAGAVAMGHAEAARIVAQPVLVLSTGLTAVLGPRAMATAIARDDRGGMQLIKRHAGLILIAGVGYLAFAGWETPWNPLPLLVPAAYVVAGLVAVSIVANVASGLVFLRVEELMAARREVDLVVVSVGASFFSILVAFTAPWTAAFAFPLSILAMSIARYVGYWFYRRKVFSQGAASVS